MFVRLLIQMNHLQRSAKAKIKLNIVFRATVLKTFGLCETQEFFLGLIVTSRWSVCINCCTSYCNSFKCLGKCSFSIVFEVNYLKTYVVFLFMDANSKKELTYQQSAWIDIGCWNKCGKACSIKHCMCT